jgi:HEAT repeat protein
MEMSDAARILDVLEANYRDALYRARWDEAAAAEVVPQLVALLDSDDRSILLRTLAAIATIGPLSHDAAPRITRLLRSSSEPWVLSAAAHALGRVSLRKPDPAVKPLIEVADVPGVEKDAMFALIGLGQAAQSAAPVFVRAFQNPCARVRRLALRGLYEIGSTSAVAEAVFRRAGQDKSKAVRDYAAKLLARRGSANQRLQLTEPALRRSVARHLPRRHDK